MPDHQEKSISFHLKSWRLVADQRCISHKTVFFRLPVLCSCLNFQAVYYQFRENLTA